MRIVQVIPNEGIGSLKLGMSPEQILSAINEELSSLYDISNNDMLISETSEGAGVTVRYMKGPYFFMVHFNNGKSVEISVNRDLRESARVVLYDIDVFLTKAEQIVNRLKQMSRLVCDWEDEQLATDYDFTDIGIRFWRDGVFHEKLLLDQEYMEKMKLVLEEEYRYLYFDMVTVKQCIDI